MYNWIKYLELLIKNYFVLTGFKYDDKNPSATENT